jgi:peptide deformylase
VAWLLKEFQTTRASLMLANPNLDPTATEMQAGESVCVLPDICTQVRRSKKTDMDFLDFYCVCQRACAGGGVVG